MNVDFILFYIATDKNKHIPQRNFNLPFQSLDIECTVSAWQNILHYSQSVEELLCPGERECDWEPYPHDNIFWCNSGGCSVWAQSKVCEFVDCDVSPSSTWKEHYGNFFEFEQTKCNLFIDPRNEGMYLFIYFFSLCTHND